MTESRDTQDAIRESLQEPERVEAIAFTPQELEIISEAASYTGESIEAFIRRTAMTEAADLIENLCEDCNQHIGADEDVCEDCQANRDEDGNGYN